MPFKVTYHVWEPGKQAPKITTENRALAHIELGSMRNKDGLALARMTHDVTPIDLTGPEKFLWLVYRVRKAQEVYFSARRQDLPEEVLESYLAQKKTLEKELDKSIVNARFYLQGHPKSQHDEIAYSFFLIVEAWREKAKEYSVYRFLQEKDPAVEKQMKKEYFDYISNIDGYINKNIGL